MVDDRLGKKAKVSRFVKSYYGGRIQSVLHRFLAQRMYIERGETNVGAAEVHFGGSGRPKNSRPQCS